MVKKAQLQLWSTEDGGAWAIFSFGHVPLDSFSLNQIKSAIDDAGYDQLIDPEIIKFQHGYMMETDDTDYPWVKCDEFSGSEKITVHWF